MQRLATATSLLVLFAIAAQAQKTTFTGTVLVYGSGMNTRTMTRTFTLNISGRTTDAEASRLLGILQNGGQDDLLSAIKNNDLGNFSIGGQVSRTVNAVRVESAGVKLRVRAIFERWLGFGEIRGGYRSVDYPFTYLEILIDPRTGKGDGTYIGAARIRFKNNQVEIEDFGTFPGRLMGVTMRGGRIS